MQWNLVLVNDLFKSKGSVANCMTCRAPVHTGNSTEQFLHRNGTLLLVHTDTGQFSKRNGGEQRPVQYSMNMAAATYARITSFLCHRRNNSLLCFYKSKSIMQVLAANILIRIPIVKIVCEWFLL